KITCAALSRELLTVLRSPLFLRAKLRNRWVRAPARPPCVVLRPPRHDSVPGIGNPGGLPQPRTGLFKKSVHPMTLATCIVIFTDRLLRWLPFRGWRLVIAFRDLQLLA